MAPAPGGWVPDQRRSHEMPKEEFRTEHATASMGSKAASDQIADTGRKIGNATLQAQSEFLKTIEEMGRHWVTSATGEVEIGLKLSKKLTAAHTVPDAMSACQEWLSEEMNARAEDARRFMTNGQKFMDAGARLMSNNWPAANS
jgi:hypothetical protein